MSCFTHNKSTLRKSRFIPILFFLLFFSLALFIACGGSSNSTEDNPAAPQTTPGDTENPDDAENPGEPEKIVQRKSLRWLTFYDVCALYDEGTPWCWDRANPNEKIFKKITDDKYISLSLYNYDSTHACGVKEDGKLFCWSLEYYEDDLYAQNLYSSSDIGTYTPVQVSEGITDKTFSSIEMNELYACALENSGKLYCWGRNDSGRLGIGTDENKPRAPTLVKTDLTFTDYSLSESHVCALEPSGKAYCWGSNTYGQLGNDTTTPVNKPVAVVTDQLFRQIYNHSSISKQTSNTCALNKDYELFCWGKNTLLDLDSKIPKKMNTNDLKFSSIDFTSKAICGISDAQELYCWGELNDEELVSGDSNVSSTPLKVLTDIKFKRVLGNDNYLVNMLNCAISVENLLYCWGTGSASINDLVGVYPYNPTPVKQFEGLSGKIYIPE